MSQIAFGQAALRREGVDVTVVAWGDCIELAEAASEEVAADGISVEIIDLRTLAPCDWEAMNPAWPRPVAWWWFRR